MPEFRPPHYPNRRSSLGIFLILIVSMLVFTPVLLLFEPIAGRENAFLLYFMFATGAPAWYVYRKREQHNKESGFKLGLGGVVVALLSILATAGLLMGITAPLQELMPDPGWGIEMRREMGRMAHPAVLIAIVVAAPILEEVIFRGVMLDGLLKNYSPQRAIIFSAMLFGAIHLNPWQFVSAFVMGLFLGWVYYRTRSLGLAVLIHATNNLVALLPVLVMDPDELTEAAASTVELYGGWGPWALITLSALALFVVCAYVLKKRFDKNFESPGSLHGRSENSG